MDVSSKAKEDIWDKVCEFFSNLEVPHVRNVDTVIFFIFGTYLPCNSINENTHAKKDHFQYMSECKRCCCDHENEPILHTFD